MENGENHSGFSLPGGYFSDSGTRLINAIECREELREFPSLVSLKGQIPFVTPEKYFESPREVVFTANLPPHSEPGFIIPEGYFHKLDERLRTDLVLTLALGNKIANGGFSAPDGYFKKTVIRSVPSGKPKIFILPAARKFVFAAAAALLVVIGFWTYRTFLLETEPDCLTIACLDKEDVLDRLSDDELMQFVDENELEQALGLEISPAATDDSLGGQKNE